MYVLRILILISLDYFMQSKEITIGGYLPGNSFLHKLDPRTKLIALGVLLGTVFAAPCSYKILLPTLSAILAVFLSQIGWRVWINGLRKFSLMLLITLVLNFTLNQEGVPIQFFGFITPFSYDGLTNAAFLTSKITLVIIFSLALTFTTLPWNIVKGLKFLIRPLRIIGVSTGDASLVLFLALRFVPLFQEEWLRLIEAQQSRGIELTSGALLIRSKRLMSLIIPSMLLAFRKSEKLSTAMTIRGFRSCQARTEYDPPIFSYRDFYVCGYILLISFGMIFV